MKEFDIIFVGGELYFDHPLCGVAVLKRILEKHGFSVGVISKPLKEKDVSIFGKPRLFFAVTSGSIDSMVRNYTPLKKLRQNDKKLNYNEEVPDRAVIVYSNWIRQNFKDSKLVLGGTEASLRRFAHYDYWDNKIRKPILFDSRADILSYGFSEKQILEIAKRIKEHKSLENIQGTCIIVKDKPGNIKIIEIPSWNQLQGNHNDSKIKFCEMQKKINIKDNIIQKIDNRYILQYKYPNYTSEDLDEIYELPFTRDIKDKHLEGFIFSIVTHRGCIGDCSFCSITNIAGDKIISRSKESIIKEIKHITSLPNFRGNIDDLGGPSANMYGMDCYLRESCRKKCLVCKKLDRTQEKWIDLLRSARKIKGVKKVNIRSGLRYDLLIKNHLKEVLENHVFETLRIAPEHTSENVLKAMNKNYGNLNNFINMFNDVSKSSKHKVKLSFYFMTAHPGSTMKEATKLRKDIEKLKNAETVQIFTPTPMTISTAMYWTGMVPDTLEKIYVPYSYNEKKEQKRILFEGNYNMKGYVGMNKISRRVSKRINYK